MNANLSKAATAVNKHFNDFQQLCDDTDLFHGGSECYPSRKKFNQQLEEIVKRFGFKDFEAFEDEIDKRISSRAAYYLVQGHMGE